MGVASISEWDPHEVGAIQQNVKEKAFQTFPATKSGEEELGTG